MAYTLEQVSAKLEIHDLLYRYAELIDAKAFDQLNEVFTDDAFIDYTALGGEKGNLPETIDFLQRSLTDAFPSHQHLNANCQITLPLSMILAKQQAVLCVSIRWKWPLKKGRIN